jgi:RHS repeat-associated protein
LANYGDLDGSGSADNMNGKAYEVFDEAGKQTFTAYDFKGNVLNKIREVVDDSVLQSALGSYSNYVMDWDTPPALSSMLFESSMAYDALNRITELELPEDLDGERKKIKPTYNTAGALEQVNLISPNGGSPVSTNYVENIAYNAKGQRLLIAFGNNRMTRYTYDPRTFRLQRQRTEGYSKSVAGDTITYAYTSGTNKQDDGFNYDLAGNIVNIFTRVTDCGIQGSIPGKDALNREFGYDALYRLTFADGREADTQSGNSYLYDDAPAPGTPNANNVRAYERTYNYDKLGNMLSVVQADVNGFTREYTYNPGKNTLQKIEDGSSSVLESYSYDSCGNTLNSSLNRKYTWNHADQLICYKNQVGAGTPTVYAQYDYAGQDRVSKMVRTGTSGSPIYERTIYIDGVFEYMSLKSPGGDYEKNYIHIMDDKSRISEVRINPGTAFPGDITDDVVYLLEDQIGSSVVRLNTSGTVIDEEEYYPFGDSSLRTFTYKRYRYVGKERDDESGLYYYGARYYVPWLCRFISCDPKAAEFPNQSSYNYCFNNPINLIDPDGQAPGGPDDPPKSDNTNITYKGGIQIYEAAEAKGAVPGGHSKAIESFKVGEYDVLPNYVTDDKGKEVFSHYTASIMVDQVKSGGGTEQVARIDYVFGKADLQTFKDKATLFATAANMIFGADVHLTKGKIEMLNGNGAGAYVKELYTSDPVGAAFAFTAGFYGLMRGQYFKPNGGSETGDFVGHGANKHKFDPSRVETRNSSQFGRNVDVARLTEHTMKYGDVKPQVDASGNVYATKYSASFGFNVGTKAMPTDAVRVFINHINPAKSTVFPKK